MTLIMTLLVRDEADIVAANIDYHLEQGVDFIIATDNCSVDATAGILKSYEARGVLRYIHEPADDYNQTAWVTRMARMAYRDYHASWVINNDADEFWWPRSGDLRGTFETLPPEVNVVRAERYNFIAVPGDDLFCRRMIYREAASFNLFGMPLPPKAAHRGSSDVVVAQGNHDVTINPPASPCEGLIDIFHFPIRSYEQIHNKISKGGAAYERNTLLPSSTGMTWRKLYAELKTEKNLFRYFEANCPSEAAREHKLRTGEIVEDRRLADFISARAARSQGGVIGILGTPGN